jgi:hypothetical protein
MHHAANRVLLLIFIVLFIFFLIVIVLLILLLARFVVWPLSLTFTRQSKIEGSLAATVRERASRVRAHPSLTVGASLPKHTR